MAIIKIVLFQCLILATVHLLMAENDEGGLFGMPSGKFGPGLERPDGDKQGDDRFFFNPSITFASCNYTATPGRSCLSCNQTQTCMQSNIGIIKTCHGRMRFCVNGACSRNPSEACNATASANSTTFG